MSFQYSPILDWASAQRVTAVFISAVIGTTLYGLATSLYSLYLGPSSKIPGPKLWAFTELAYLYYFYRNEAPHKINQLHQKYGRVIRIGPKTFSTIDPESWNIIYGQQTTKRFPKANYALMDPKSTATNLVNATEVDHVRQRKLINHAFSEKALKDQEEIIMTYIQTLISKFQEISTETKDGGEVSISKWMEFLTFDVVSDLAFGEPFGSLSGSSYHPWVAGFPRVVSVLAVMGQLVRFKLLSFLYLLTLSKHDKEAFRSHAEVIDLKVRRRLDMGAERKDIMSYILRHSGDKGMSRQEIEQNASIFVLAGSETTATSLTIAMYQLARNPDIMSQLVAEIRAAFKSEDEINITTVQHLKYLRAVFMEGMRCFPPVPIGPPRWVPPEGAMVDGHHIPGGTIISIPQLAAYSSPANFKNPLKYDPSRWLGNPEYAGDHLEVVQPFSHGTRNCVGRNLAWAEMNMTLVRMCWNFDWELLPGEEFDISRQDCQVMWRKPPMNVKLRPRAV